MQVVDVDGDGSVTFEEFYQLMTSKLGERKVHGVRVVVVRAEGLVRVAEGCSPAVRLEGALRTKDGPVTTQFIDDTVAPRFDEAFFIPVRKSRPGQLQVAVIHQHMVIGADGRKARPLIGSGVVDLSLLPEEGAKTVALALTRLPGENFRPGASKSTRSKSARGSGLNATTAAALSFASTLSATKGRGGRGAGAGHAKGKASLMSLVVPGANGPPTKRLPGQPRRKGKGKVSTPSSQKAGSSASERRDSIQGPGEAMEAGVLHLELSRDVEVRASGTMSALPNFLRELSGGNILEATGAIADQGSFGIAAIEAELLTMIEEATARRSDLTEVRTPASSRREPRPSQPGQGPGGAPAYELVWYSKIDTLDHGFTSLSSLARYAESEYPVLKESIASFALAYKLLVIKGAAGEVLGLQPTSSVTRRTWVHVNDWVKVTACALVVVRVMAAAQKFCQQSGAPKPKYFVKDEGAFRYILIKTQASAWLPYTKDIFSLCRASDGAQPGDLRELIFELYMNRFFNEQCNFLKIRSAREQVKTVKTDKGGGLKPGGKRGGKSAGHVEVGTVSFNTLATKRGPTKGGGVGGRGARLVGRGRGRGGRGRRNLR